MNFNDLPLLSMLKDRLGYLNERQSVIAQNVANSDTPGYTPNDLKPFTVAEPGQGPAPVLAPAPVTPTLTNGIHLPGKPAKSAGPYKPQKTPDSETRLDGNQVVLEEQMMKMNDSRMNYNAAINFYEQSLAMIQTAIRIPGK
ncbi:MAG: flagellar basal body rod protein FlgB [Caulobacteraceae bacterium]|nr:flagellar basal body rod protein FlgB [Caulobacteraceae bacterium]